MATEQALFDHPELVWSWLRWMARLSLASEPNAGHQVVGDWQQRLRADGGELAVITQNIDDLHQRGGAEVTAHLHGTLFTHRCAVCHEPAHYDLGTPTPEEVQASPGLQDLLMVTPPSCTACGNGFLRPDIVLFGEMLPVDDFEASVQFLETADAVIVVGTSSIVQPAASLPLIAADHGAPIIEINPVTTRLTDAADVHLSTTAATGLPLIAPNPQDS